MQYNESTLKKLQQVELGILKDFDHICRKYNIRYFAIGGTALGAVRHKGFIPWDDDIDVALLSQDYKRFVQAAKREFGEKYYILSAENNKTVPCMSIHWCKSGTRFMEEESNKMQGESGIFLDIFIYNYVYNQEKYAKDQIRKAWFFGKLYILRILKNPKLFASGAKKELLKQSLVIGHYLLKFLLMSPEYLYGLAMKYAMECEKKCGATNKVTYCFDTKPYVGVMDIKHIYPAIELEFEGIPIKFPNHIDEYLTETYGDYMTLPPVEKRHNHCPNILEFGDESL